MNWKRALIPTLREEPKEAEVKSHRLLLRAGFIRALSSGVYNYLPLGYRVIKRIEEIIREEMDRIGAQELLLPVIAAKEIWEPSGRWLDYGEDMFRLKDRKGHDLCLCPTHEEIITLIAANLLKSYKELPQIWYQIQTKFRDEPRPRGGVIRARQFIMKDSYSLDKNEEGLDRSYKLHKEAYTRIFKRCGLKFFTVEASGGLMGEGESCEFMAGVETGEDKVILCPKCGYATNAQIAKGNPEEIDFPDEPLEEVHTPGVKTVKEVSEFLQTSPSRLIKSMLFKLKDEFIMILLRGDDEISEEKLLKFLGPNMRPATLEEAKDRIGASLGFIGPVGVDLNIYADLSLKGAKGRISGANKDDYHIKGINLKRDAKIKEFIDVRRVKAQDRCYSCNTPLEEKSSIELGHIFKLGTKYSESLNAFYLDEEGNRRPIIMGSYGIGLERIMAVAVEEYADDDGISWPISIAPFDIEVVSLDDFKEGEGIAKGLEERGISVLVDDRNQTPGVKFKDADLIGIPLRIALGPKGMSRGEVDITVRKDKKRITVRKEEAVEKTMELIQGMRTGLML